jgi:hypothetical protein
LNRLGRRAARLLWCRNDVETHILGRAGDLGQSRRTRLERNPQISEKRRMGRFIATPDKTALESAVERDK